MNTEQSQTKLIECSFYAEDGSDNKYVGAFRSERQAIAFRTNWLDVGGFLRFSMDIWGTTTDPLPIIPCNRKGFEQVYRALYGNLPI
jgi:hypothetical protein